MRRSRYLNLPVPMAIVIMAIFTLACGTPATEAPVPILLLDENPVITHTPTPDIEATVVARIEATLSAMPTATAVPTSTLTPTVIPTPTDVPTATPEPTSTPIPEPTATPATTLMLEDPIAEEPPSVYGRLEIKFEPRGHAVIPEPPIEAGFVIESADGERFFEMITDPDPEGEPYYKTTTLDFSLSLEPGEYQIIRLNGFHPDFDQSLVGFPPFRVGLGTAFKISTLGFEVPESGCIHIGEISAEYYRLGPGDRSVQKQYKDSLLRELGELTSNFLPSGSLAAKLTSIDNTIDRDLWSEEAVERKCQVMVTEWIF